MTPAPAQSGQRKRAQRVLGVLAVLLAIPLIALALLLTYDWNRARPWLNARTSEAIGRPFAIAGDLTLRWERPAAQPAGSERGWRDLIPWPQLVANDVHVGNPAAMGPGELASARQLSFSLNPLALLEKRIAIPVLRFEAPAVRLRRGADGRNNWSFKEKDPRSPWRLDLERVVFSKGVVSLNDALTQADITAELDTIHADPAYGVGWKLRGSYKGAPVSGSGKAGAVLSLKQQSTPYPLQAALRVGANRIALEGTLTRPTALAALDLRLRLSGPSMARLYELTGLPLPETPAFSTAGHLSGAIGADGSHWIYDKFKGKVGSSDIGGRLEFHSGAPRGRLSGAVVSHLLQFRDLAPLIGADSNASKRARGVAPVQPPGKVLPVETFRTERWTSIDADVRFSADHIRRERQLPINKLSTHLILKDGVLALTPLRFDMAGGNVNSTIRLDASGRQGKQAIKASARVAARHIQIKQLFPAIEALKASVGQVNGDAQLSATGNSVATLLAGANGEIKTLIDQGTVSKLLLEQIGLNIGNVLLAKLFGDRQVRLNCMATDFGVRDGLMRTRTFVIDTEEAVISASGTVNLATERLDLTLRPQTKALRIFSLRAPLYLRGSFDQPAVSVDKGVLALKAGSALALAALAAPLAALLPLVNTGPGQDSACGALLAQARVKPRAPPPGKRATAR